MVGTTNDPRDLDPDHIAMCDCERRTWALGICGLCVILAGIVVLTLVAMGGWR